MSICDKAHAATQYALLSALFGLTRVGLSGALSGWATERLGYTVYFTLTFVLAWPALFLLPRVRGWSAEHADRTARSRDAPVKPAWGPPGAAPTTRYPFAPNVGNQSRRSPFRKNRWNPSRSPAAAASRFMPSFSDSVSVAMDSRR